MKTKQRFGYKMRIFDFFDNSLNTQVPAGGLLGDSNKMTLYTCTISFLHQTIPRS